jgi:hypothetical protein
MVLGIASAAVLLAFSTSIFGSSEYKSLATTDTVLRTAAEEVTNFLQQNPSDFANCSGTIDINSNLAANVKVPSGYTVSPVTATYWSTSLGTYVSQTAQEFSVPTCPAAAATNPSTLVTISIANGGHSYSISTVVNDPSAPATPSFGTASKLVFIGQPGNGTAGNSLSAPPEVAIEDASGNIVTTDLSSVQLALASTSGGSGTLSQNCSGAEIGGVVTFSNCTVAGTGGFTLTASDSHLTSATSNTFYVSSGTAAQIVFTTEPGNGTGGSALSTQPVVTVEDAYGDVVQNDSSSVSLSILPGSGASQGQLSGCSTPTENSGVFTFSGCAINLDSPTGTPYVLVATDGAWTADSSSFTVSTGVPAELIFTTSPNNTTLGTTFTSQPVVAIADAGGNPVTSASRTSVALSIASGSPNGTLGCGTNPLSTTSGSVTFASCKITLTQGSYQLLATATYSGTTITGKSTPFTVAGSAYKLYVLTSPTASQTGVAFSTQPVVEVLDSSGDLVTNSSASILLTPGAVGGGYSGSMTGCSNNPVTAVSGIATFSHCAISVSGSNGGGYFTLSATSSGLATASSSQFIVAGNPYGLAFVTVPGASTTGVAFGTQPSVEVVDKAGNLDVASSAQVTLSLASGSASGTLGCPNSSGLSANAVGGVASFAQCQITIPGTVGGQFKLNAASSSLVSTPMSNFFPVAGTATQLAFTTQPSNGTGGVNLPTQPVVTVEDAGGYTVTADSSTVVLNLNPSQGGLSDTCAGTESSGVFSFANCSVRAAANGYTFTASDVTETSLAAATSSSFNITVGAAAQLAFTTSPTGGLAGQAFSVQPVVTVEDAGGNPITTGSSLPIALSVTNGAPLACTNNTVSTSSGVSSYSGCSTTIAGANVSLSANSPGFPTAYSTSFNISPAAASMLAITSSPISGAASATPTLGPITVQETDAYGNPVAAGSSGQAISLSTSSTASPTFSYISGGSSASTVTIPYGLSYTTFYYGDQAAGSPTVTASASGFQSALQMETIVPGPAYQFVITPSTPLSGAASATANIGPITVQEQDQFGNPAPAGSNGQAVSLSATGTSTFASASGGSGATSVTIPSGGNSVGFYFGDQTLGSQTITASAPGITTSATQNETITVGTPSASQSTAVAVPATNVGATNSSGTGSTVTVTLKDAFGNPIANKAVSVTPGAGSSVVTAISATTNSSGVATFNATDTAVQTVTYTAKDTTDGITLSTKPTVSFVAATTSSTASTVLASPTSINANGIASSTITVMAQDAFNNPEIGETVTLSPSGGSSSLITTLSGTTNSSGDATFAVRDNTAEAVTYTATAGGVTLAQTPTVTFSSDPVSASASTVVAAPTTNVTANGTASSLITVTVNDAGGHPIANQSVTLTGTGHSVIATSPTTTNSSGVATFTVTDLHAETVTYTATDVTASLALGEQPTVAFVAGLASSTASTAVANPTSMTASTTNTSTIMVTVVDANGNPEIGDAVTLTSSSTHSSVATSPTTTNSMGVATFAVKDATAETVTYTATDTTDHVQLSTLPTVTYLTGLASPASSITVSPTSESVKANGNTAATISVTAKDINGNPEIGDTITLTAGSGSSVIATSPTTTNASGVATFSVTDGTPQSVTYTVTDTTDGVAFTTLPTITFASDAPATGKSSAVASPGTVTANGTASSLITVTLGDSLGTAMAGQTVTLAPSSGGSLIQTLSGVTNSSGQATFSVTDATAQTVTYTATDNTQAFSITVTPAVVFVAGTASPASVVAANPTSQLANGTSTSSIMVTAKDANGNPEIGDSITLTGTGNSVISGSPATTSSLGVATFTVKDATAETDTYTATDTTDHVQFTTLPTVTFTADPASSTNSSASANPTTGVTANGSASSLITVTLKDAGGNLMANQSVTLSGTGHSVITTSPAITSSSGVATFTVTDLHAETVTYTVTAGGVTLGTQPTVAFVAGTVSASASTVSANPATGVVAGSGSSTITVTAVDANGNPEVGDSVTLTSSSTHSSVVTSPTTTNSGGVATFTVSDTKAETVTYTAKDVTDSNTTITQKPTVAYVAGLASASSSITTNPTSGSTGSSATITVTATDANGNPEVGDSITLTAGSGSSSINTSPTTTNSSGVATFTVTDTVRFGQSVTYTAKDTTDGVTFTTQPTINFSN